MWFALGGRQGMVGGHLNSHTLHLHLTAINFLILQMENLVGHLTEHNEHFFLTGRSAFHRSIRLVEPKQ